MKPGSVSTEWRFDRVETRVEITSDTPFVNIDSPDTVAELGGNPELMASLRLLFGVEELDVSVIKGRDRRVTRFIAEYISQMTDDSESPRWSGIRYTSRLGEAWECWAVFEGTQFEISERRARCEDITGSDCSRETIQNDSPLEGEHGLGAEAERPALQVRLPPRCDTAC